MNVKLSYEKHIQRNQSLVKEILQRVKADYLVIHSGIAKYTFMDDRTYPFEVNPHFKAWLPVIDNPNCFVITDGVSKPELIFYQPEDFWHVVPEDPTDFWVDSFKLTKLQDKDKLKFDINLKNTIFLGEDIEYAKELGFIRTNDQELVNFLHYHRMYKTEYEQYCLKEASKIGVRAHKAAFSAFKAGGSEFQIQLAYLEAAAQSENQMPYGNIIALNKNAAILHYTDLQHKRFDPKDIHSFLIDAGGNFNGYASDITRTYSYRDDEFSELISAMEKAELELVQEVKIGQSYGEAHLKSHLKIAQILSDFKFIDLNAEDIVAKELVYPFFPHGLGHSLGLQVHDVGAKFKDDKGQLAEAPKEHPNLRSNRLIEANMVFTVEPGLYFIDLLLKKVKASENSKYLNWSKLESFSKYGGIRIEDDIIIHDDRNENMTRDLGL